MKKCAELKSELINKILEKARINYLDFQDKMLDSPQIEVWKNSSKICIYQSLLDYLHDNLAKFPFEKLIYMRDDSILDKLIEKHQQLYYGNSNRDFERLIGNYVENERQTELKDTEEME